MQSFNWDIRELQDKKLMNVYRLKFGSKMSLSDQIDSELETIGEIVKEQGIKTKPQWEAFCKSGKRPSDVPSNPSRFYKEEWKGWKDFLGTAKEDPLIHSQSKN